MDNETTLTDYGIQMQGLIEEVRSDICDHYCKFAAQNRPADEMRSICNNCPLNRLD